MRRFLLGLIFGLAADASAQVAAPDTTGADSLQPKPPTDTVLVQGRDTSSRGADTLALPSATDTSGKKTLVPEKKTNFPSPSGALLRSLAIPGWGQLYNKKYFKAVIIAGGQGTLLGTAVVEWKRASDAKDDLDLEGYRVHTNNRNLFLWLYAAATAVSMLDAYVDAHLSQDTGEGVPKIGNIFFESDAEKKSFLVKIKVDF
ncbi:MAG: DUF5683 domain-containing protein [candidate division Zixibacteria bacterium]|nr:DUF5683 domain-containing protein [candidate division Zixibacteria bacterium]